MTTTQGQFKLDMDGLLEVLAGSLYTSPDVGLRELIQNAHDSCVRFKIEARPQSYQPRIDIELEDKSLTIRDNGSGLTLEEIETYLTTIGRSYTGEMREDLSLFEMETAQELIGQFGFGFLSAFLLTDQVAIETLSWQPNSEPLRITTEGSDSFTVESGSRLTRGTTIQMRLHAYGAFLFDPDILAQRIGMFANFLPIPIYLNGGDQPENQMIAPWNQLDPAQAIVRFIESEFHMPPPLAVIQLHDYTERLSDGDAFEASISGFLFIPDSSIASVREYGDVHVYIRDMYITNDEKDLLPPWAKFVRGLVESPFLHPTASRESVRRDENFTLVREALGQQLMAGLQEIRNANPSLWKRIVDGHADVMTAWAVRNDDFFEEVASILTFRTSQGQMTLPEYLKLTEGRLYYATREIRSLQEKTLAEGNAFPVIEAVWFAVRPFLQKYAQEQGGIELISLDEEPTRLFQEVDIQEYTDLLAVAERLNLPARIAAFEPSQIPALVIYPKDVEQRLDTRRALDDDELDPEFSTLISSYVEEHPELEETEGTLFFNARCPFVNQLDSAGYTEHHLQLIIEMLYQIARLFSGRTMTAAAAIEAFTSLTDSIGELSK